MDPARDNLKRRVTAGGIWAVLGRGSTHAVRFLRVMLLARLLTPHAFGVVGMALFAIDILETFTSPGIDAALVRRKELRPVLNTAFTIKAVRGVLLGILLVLLAPLGARAFSEPDLVVVLRALAVTSALRGLLNPATVQLYRKLRFRTIFAWDLTEAVTGTVIALGVAFYTRGVWPLVASVVGAQLVRTVMSWFIVQERPSLKFERAIARELHSFGKWASSASILMFLNVQGDNAFVGKFLGASALGIYQLAFRLAELPVTLISQVAMDIAYPAFSRMQEQPERLARWYRSAERKLLLANGGLALVLFLFAGPITTILFGPQWTEAIPALRILAIACGLRSLIVFGQPLFYAVNRPELHVRVNLVRLLGMGLTIYPLARLYGLTGIALSVLVAVLVALPVYVHGVRVALTPNGQKSKDGTPITQITQITQIGSS